jgi:hypothetical protein
MQVAVVVADIQLLLVALAATAAAVLVKRLVMEGMQLLIQAVAAAHPLLREAAPVVQAAVVL